jgi:hypothetical protein
VQQRLHWWVKDPISGGTALICCEYDRFVRDWNADTQPQNCVLWNCAVVADPGTGDLVLEKLLRRLLYVYPLLVVETATSLQTQWPQVMGSRHHVGEYVVVVASS